MPGRATGADGVRLTVRLHPRASCDRVEGLDPEGTLRVKVRAAPVDGAANESLLKLIAGRLRIPRSNVTLRSGAGSRHKVLEVRGAGGGREDILDRLTKET
jgi:uncharacterized protein (TIGR00251 family)